MPELPEVETVVRSLRPFLRGQVLRAYHVHWPGIMATRLPREIIGQTIQGIDRRAKFVVLSLETGYLTIHLRMTGQLIPVSECSETPPAHVHFVMEFSQGGLLFQDVRKFGRVGFLKKKEYPGWHETWGLEPLSEDFTARWFVSQARNRRRRLKTALLDQRWIAGLGNIYVDEALWQARLHPERMCSSLLPAEGRALVGAIRKVLQRAIQANGTSFMDFKFLGGEKGGYTEELKVFRRTGQGCLRCGHTIQRIKVAQRSTHFCPVCQPSRAVPAR